MLSPPVPFPAVKSPPAQVNVQSVPNIRDSMSAHNATMVMQRLHIPFHAGRIATWKISSTGGHPHGSSIGTCTHCSTDGSGRKPHGKVRALLPRICSKLERGGAYLGT